MLALYTIGKRSQSELLANVRRQHVNTVPHQRDRGVMRPLSGRLIFTAEVRSQIVERRQDIG